MTDESVRRATTQDLADQNYDKVFPNGFAADQEPEHQQLQVIEGDGQELPVDPEVEQWKPPQIAARPSFGINQLELDASKMMSTAGPLIPRWLRNRPGHCWGIIQLSKRWTRYNAATNTWTHYDPITIAQATYLVTSQEDPEGNVAYMSVFIRALIDSFAPIKGKMRYLWHGEGQERKCTCSAIFRGETEAHSYTTPPLRQISPKKSPLWSTDPDRQLAYYASRAWARLHCAGVLQGIYDEDELEGRRMEIARESGAMLPPARLHERLQEARQARGSGGAGFRPGVVQAGLKAEEEPAAEARDAPKPAGRPKDSGQPKKRTGGLRSAKKTAPPAKAKAKRPESRPKPAPEPKAQVAPQSEPEPEQPQAMEPLPPPPRNLAEYRAHVARWLPKHVTEQDVEDRWRNERRLRNQCGVTEEDRLQIKTELVDQHILELRNRDRS